MSDPGTKANQYQIRSPRRPGFYLHTAVSKVPAVDDVGDSDTPPRGKTADAVDVTHLRAEAQVSDFPPTRC